jgi:hypothetical protein
MSFFIQHTIKSILMKYSMKMWMDYYYLHASLKE